MRPPSCKSGPQRRLEAGDWTGTLYATRLPDGGIIDDLLIYHLSENAYMLVVNAGNIDKDYAWVEQQSQNFPNLQLDNQSDTTALLALQGPLAQSILRPLTEVDLANIPYYHFEAGLVDGVHCIISRTGYTGEDGFEFFTLLRSIP